MDEELLYMRDDMRHGNYKYAVSFLNLEAFFRDLRLAVSEYEAGFGVLWQLVRENFAIDLGIFLDDKV
ncbi:MAG: hypothetical protein NTW84_07500, partial [Methanothrix sp.]|nr:hypothetical protein [Methanothrix sp.]